MIIFADDTNIFCTGESIAELCKLVSIELRKLHIWFSINKLSVNISKTNFMVFGKKYANIICNVYINEFKIERVYIAKFLGVTIDSELTWREQSINVKNKVFRNLAVLKKVKHLLNRDAMLRLYSSIIQSHMSYCVELWGNCNKSFLLPIIKAQTMAVRIVCDLKAREHTSTYFKELNILKFPHLVEAKIKVLMFKAWNCKLPDSLQCLFNTKSVNRYQTRKPNNFKVKFF